MKVIWEESDLRPGTRVFREMECIIGGNPHDYRDPAVLMVLETGRVMKIGSKKEVADYMTENGYQPIPK